MKKSYIILYFIIFISIFSLSCGKNEYQYLDSWISYEKEDADFGILVPYDDWELLNNITQEMKIYNIKDIKKITEYRYYIKYFLGKSIKKPLKKYCWKIIYKYNRKNHLIKKIRYGLDTSHIFEYYYIYNEKDKIIAEIDKINQTFYKYNDKGIIIEKSEVSLKMFTNKVMYEYDDNKNIIEKQKYSCIIKSLEYKIVYKYNKKGNLINKIMYFSPIILTDDPDYQMDIEYNKNGYVSEVLRSKLGSMMIVPNRRTIFKYDRKDKIIEKEVFNSNWTSIFTKGIKLIPDYKINYKYNNYGYIAEKVKYKFKKFLGIFGKGKYKKVGIIEYKYTKY